MDSGRAPTLLELQAAAYWHAVDIARAWGFPVPSPESYGFRKAPRRSRT